MRQLLHHFQYTALILFGIIKLIRKWFEFQSFFWRWQTPQYWANLRFDQYGGFTSSKKKLQISYHYPMNLIIPNKITILLHMLLCHSDPINCWLFQRKDSYHILPWRYKLPLTSPATFMFYCKSKVVWKLWRCVVLKEWLDKSFSFPKCYHTTSK